MPFKIMVISDFSDINLLQFASSRLAGEYHSWSCYQVGSEMLCLNLSLTDLLLSLKTEPGPAGPIGETGKPGPPVSVTSITRTNHETRRSYANY